MLKQIALSNWVVILIFLFTISIVLFLFYIDEGYYSFSWMQDPGAWIVFFIYCNLFFWPLISLAFLINYFFKK